MNNQKSIFTGYFVKVFFTCCIKITGRAEKQKLQKYVNTAKTAE